MAETEDEKKVGDYNEGQGLNRDGSPKITPPGSGNTVSPGSNNSSVRPEKAVTFTPDQIALIDKMFKDRSKAEKSSRSPNAISMYNLRDPKAIQSVKVSRFDGHWVIGFKDLQQDPYKKNKQYLRYGVDPIRKLFNEPFVTLLLTDDGEKITEKEVMLITYMENRDQKDIPVIEKKEHPRINDHGVLGSNGNYAVAIDDKGAVESRPTILQQSKSVDLSFIIQPDGFKTPHEFSTDFLG